LCDDDEACLLLPLFLLGLFADERTCGAASFTVVVV